VAEVVHVAQEVLPEAESRLRVHGISSAWRLLPDAQIGIVRLATTGELDLLCRELTRLARARVGVSPTYTTLLETSSALRLARMALSTARTGTVQVRRFDEHPLGVAAVNASAAMDRVVQIVLGPVLNQPAQDRAVLLETLGAWRDNHGSTEGAARQLYCHPNTIRLRLRRVEAATGRLLSDPRAAAEILLALEAVESGALNPDADQ
jgi:DNA-binding PucR family transcriptional regulator